MRNEQKQAIRMAGGLLALCTVFVVIAAAVPGSTLAAWGERIALLSVGFQQPEGGAELLSERLDRQPAKGNVSVGSTTSASTAGTAATQGKPGAGEQQPGSDVPAVTPSTVPTRGPKGGVVEEQRLTIGSSFIDGVAVKNSSGTTVDIAAQLKIKPKLTIKKTGEPQVLIVHTHTTESYMTYYAGYYNDADVARSKDEKRNVCAVGEVVAAQLRAAGIGVIHDTAVHDSPQYTGAYDRSAATVQKNMKEHPTIQVVIDLHRDAIMRNASTKVKPTVTIGGRKAAQMMIITGVLDTKALPHPNWRENLRLTLRLQQALHTQYEGIIRPMSLVGSRYNQHLAPGAMLVEVGTDANTLDEAVYSGEILGKTLAQVLKTLQ